MTYVPTPVVAPTANVTPRARDLARSLEQAIHEYRERNPTLTDAEIVQALTVVSSQRTAVASRAVLVGSLLLGLLLAALAVYLVL